VRTSLSHKLVTKTRKSSASVLDGYLSSLSVCVCVCVTIKVFSQLLPIWFLSFGKNTVIDKIWWCWLSPLEMQSPDDWFHFG
jgi:hypothetical protein